MAASTQRERRAVQRRAEGSGKHSSCSPSGLSYGAQAHFESRPACSRRSRNLVRATLARSSGQSARGFPPSCSLHCAAKAQLRRQERRSSRAAPWPASPTPLQRSGRRVSGKSTARCAKVRHAPNPAFSWPTKVRQRRECSPRLALVAASRLLVVPRTSSWRTAPAFAAHLQQRP